MIALKSYPNKFFIFEFDIRKCSKCQDDFLGVVVLWKCTCQASSPVVGFSCAYCWVGGLASQCMAVRLLVLVAKLCDESASHVKNKQAKTTLNI